MIVIRIILYVYRFVRVTIDPVGYARWIGVRIGNDCHLPGARESMFGSEPYLIKIGDNVTVSHDCDFITHDGGIRQFRKIAPDIDIMGPIIIGNDVFVGAHSVLLPDTILGDRCVVGSGAMVKGHFEPDSLIVGNPARRIGSVQDYWERARSKTVPTFFLKPKEKRKFLEDYYWHNSAD